MGVRTNGRPERGVGGAWARLWPLPARRRRADPQDSGRPSSFRRRAPLVLGGLVALHLGRLLPGVAAPPADFGPHPLWPWSPALAVGLVLVAWLGPRAALLVLADSVLFAVQEMMWGRLPGGTALGDALLLAGWTGAVEALGAWAAWWGYHRLARGSADLAEPRSAVLFLVMVPGLAAGLVAVGQAAPFLSVAEPDVGLVIELWLGQAVGALAFAPLLLVLASPAAPFAGPASDAGVLARWGERVELLLLALGTAIFGYLLGLGPGQVPRTGWPLWGLPLLLVVWAALRQGMRGGTVVCAAAALGAALGCRRAEAPGLAAAVLLQANLLAQASTVLLVAAAASWVRRSERCYRQVVGQVPVLLYSCQAAPVQTPGRPPRAEVTFVSPASLEVLGRPPEELLGDHGRWLDLLVPGDREVLLAALAQLAKPAHPAATSPNAAPEARSVTCEYRIRPPAGEDGPGPARRGAAPQGSRVIALRPPGADERWVRDTLTGRYAADGRLVGWDGVAVDVTEQRRLADDLRRTTTLFYGLLANMPAGVFFLDAATGRPILVNARARQLLGQRENVNASLGRLAEVYRLYRPDGTPYPSEQLPVCRALRGAATTACDDIVVHRPDGRQVPLVTWAAPVDSHGRGRPDAAVWVFEDLANLPHYRAEAIRRQSEEKYRELVESLPVMVVQIDSGLRVNYINPAVRDITGYELDELRDPAAWQPLLHEADRERALAALAEALGGKVARLEVRYQARNGEERVALCIVQPRRQDGEPAGATVLVVDVTRERRLEAELQRAQRLELIGRLSSGIAHDFNNLLTVILGLTDLARGELAPRGGELGDCLDRIAEAGEQAAGLARQLLSLSRQKPAAARQIELNRIVRSTLNVVQAALPPNVLLECALADDALPVRADETQLQQVLMNLCLNARDAMPEGGVLHVETGASSGQGDEALAEWVWLAVRDTGQGMPADVRARIFDPFFSTKERGTGLGLAVVQQIVEAHGGRVEVWSEPGCGACFEVRLPRAEVTSAPLPESGAVISG